MIAEALAKLAELAADRRSHVLLDPERPDRAWLVGPAGGAEPLEYLPEVREHALASLESFAAMVADPVIASEPEVYFNLGGCEVILDRADRRGRGGLAFVSSQRWSRLEQLTRREPMSQKDAVRLLRYDLGGTGVETVVAALRKLDFQRTSSGGKTLEHGRESLGRAVEAAVQQADSIPEEFTVSTPVWNTAGLTGIQVKVRCALELDPERETISIFPMPDSLELAGVEAMAQLEKRIREALGVDVPIFRGIA